jgi:hypothetical protein
LLESARIWKAAHAVSFYTNAQQVLSADFAADDTRILTQSKDSRGELSGGRVREIVERTWRLWNIEGEPVELPLQHESPIQGALLSADHAGILTWGGGTARVLSAASGSVGNFV